MSIEIVKLLSAEGLKGSKLEEGVFGTVNGRFEDDVSGDSYIFFCPAGSLINHLIDADRVEIVEETEELKAMFDYTDEDIQTMLEEAKKDPNVTAMPVSDATNEEAAKREAEEDNA